MKSLNYMGMSCMVFLSILLLSNCSSNKGYNNEVQYSNPNWAPTYYSGVRYYYLPDIEVYYDLSGQEFVYLDNGQWLFTRNFPNYYSGFDLDNCFVVALDYNVFQPWMHHQYYLSHYPRYYYRNVYREDERERIRGFNENERKPIYHRQEVRPKINVPRKQERIEKRLELTREPQPPHYYGKEIGRPVKVKPDMKEKRKESPRIEKNNNNKEFKKEEIRKENKREDRKEVRPR